MPRWLDQDRIHAIHQAILGAGMARDPLLSGLDPHMVASLRTAVRPDEQLLLDLNGLNETEALADGTLPLRAWLKNAMLLLKAAPSKASEVAAALRELEAALAALASPDAHRALWIDLVVQRAARRTALGGVIAGLGLDLAKVRVPVVLSLDRDGKHPSLTLTDLLDGARDARYTVLGDAGAGKTEMLLFTAAALAERAKTVQGAPLPVVVRARDLAAGLKAAIMESWRIPDELASYLVDGRARLTLFVDGLDEAPRRAIEDIDTTVRCLGDRCAALIVASRPVLRSPDVRGKERWLLRWSAEASATFLAQCAKLLPDEVKALRRAQSSALAELLGNPLTATLCLLVAKHQPDALRSRAALFGAVVERLVVDWIREREVSDVEPADLMPGLETLALELARQHRRAVTESDIRRVFRRDLGYQVSRAVEGVEVHLGMLVRRDGTRFDFAFRGLAEHLAGRALLREGQATVIQAAQEPWGTEAARHAVGWAASQAPGEGAAFIDSILHLAHDGLHSWTNRTLRALLVGIRTAGDLDELPESTVSGLHRATFAELTEETSVWTGERVGAAVEEWTRARPKTAMKLVQAALHCILRPGTPADWYEACQGGPEELLAPLLHRDPGVRWVYTQKLIALADQPEVRGQLLLVLMDDGYDPWRQPVAMGAGWALRHARRDEHFAELLPSLLQLLKNGRQFQCVGAALALLPGEAEPGMLARGFALGLQGSGFSVQREALDDLAATEEGRRALDRACPDWRDKKERAKDGGGTPTPGKLVPHSREVRERLLRAVAPALRRAPEALLGKLHEAHGVTLSILVCELAIDYPEPVCTLLRAAPEKSLAAYQDAELERLSRAALWHPQVRDALLDLWRRIESTGVDQRVSQWKCDYPGRSLDGLVRAGDEEAQRIFSEWLGFTHHVIPFQTFGAPLLQGFDCPPVIRDAGHAIALRTFHQHADGWMDADGKHTRLAVQSAAEALFRLSSFWRHDRDLRRQVERWLMTGQATEFRCALWALQDIGVTEEARRALPSSFDALLHKGDAPFFGESLWGILVLMEHLGVLQDLREAVEDLVQQDETSAIATALTLPWHDPSEQRLRSGRIAERLFLLDHLPFHLAERLVLAHPSAWASRLQNVAHELGNLGDWIPVLRALPVKLQARVAADWAEVAQELPWVSDGIGRTCVRPADRVRQVLFDLGLEEPATGSQ